MRFPVCRRLFAVCLICCLAAGSAAPAFAAGNDTVQRAWALRMEGRADEAKAILVEAIAADPKNAAAHHELARTLLHMGLGDPRSIDVDAIRAEADRAAALEEGNLCYALFAAKAAFFMSYWKMAREEEGAEEAFTVMCDRFRSVLALDPDRLDIRLNLVEALATIPEDMGGDREAAEAQAAILEEKDIVYGAKARVFFLPEETDRLAYWLDVADRVGENAEVLEEIGKARMAAGDGAAGEECFERAIRIDPAKTFLLLDLARHHLMSCRGETSRAGELMPRACDAIKRYLRTDPPAPMEAYATVMLARARRLLGEREYAGKLAERAGEIDPWHSRASGLPGESLFTPPGETPIAHRYLYRPM